MQKLKWDKALAYFKTEVIAKSKINHARITRVTTFHGTFETPTFMPVATRAFVNHMTPNDLIDSGSQIILGGNTYHMLVNPGMEIICASGGMHQFMNWHKPMLTDSGGFQVFSLSQNKKICTIDENGAHFKHPINGKIIHLTPKSSIETQKIIGADIIMAFDECTPESGGYDAAVKAMDRTHRWLMESKAVHDASPNSAYGYPQALFGIIQGGSFQDLREKSAEFIINADMDGIAIGGEIIGFDREKTAEVINWIRPMLPEHKTRYTMGVGLGPQDLIEVVANGIDIFDCVAPTRNARHGALYHGKFIQENGWIKFEGINGSDRLLIKKSIYAKDETPIMDDCTCTTCQQFTKAYLHFLFKQQSSLYHQLACIHNVHVMQEACTLMRAMIN